MSLSSVPSIVLLLVGALSIPLFCVCVYVVESARFSSPISRRVYPLLMISLVANFVNMLTYLAQGIVYFAGNDKAAMGLFFYLELLTEYWFFTPYLCRVYHVKVSSIDKSKLCRVGRQLYFRQSLRYMLWGFAPLVIVVVVLACCSPLGQYPFSLQGSGASDNLYRHAVWLFVYFVQCMAWLASVYQLRFIATKYSISAELTITCLIFCVSELVQHPFFTEWLFFNVTLRNTAIMCISSLWPALREKKAHSETLVTPEVLSCFELALLHRDSIAVFLQFLRSGEKEVQDGEDLLWFVLALNELEAEPSLEGAREVFEKFVERTNAFEKQVVAHTKSVLESQPEVEVLFEVFADCRRIALRKLKYFHFSQFLQSSQFENYRRKVEATSKQIGSFEASLQEMQ